MQDTTAVVLDTNVFVAAGFKPESDSAKILQQIRDGSLRLVWNQETYRETQHILLKIPPLSWTSIANLFQEENHYRGPTYPESFLHVPDPEDRKFAALAVQVGVVLISLDRHLLAGREQSPVPILTPSEFVQQSPKLRQQSSEPPYK